MKANRYEVKKWIAKQRDIPRTFVAVPVRETAKAIQLYGHGTTGDLVTCVACGRELTHPVSRLVGIGPKCGQHFWDESILGPFGFTEEHAEKLKRMVSEIKIDKVWIPKSCVLSSVPVNEEIEIEKEVNDVRQSDRKSAPESERNPLVARRDIEVSEEGRRDQEQDRLVDEQSETDNGSGSDQGSGGPSGMDPRKAGQDDMKKRVTFNVDGDKIEVRFDYDQDLVAKVRAMNLSRPKFVRNGQDRWWNLALDPKNVEKLSDLGFKIDKPVWDWYKKITEPRPKVAKLPEWTEDLYGFQKDGVKWLDEHNGNGIVGDEMGLGKTIQALGWLRLNPEALPALVICPASLKINWQREAETWLPDTKKIAVINGRPKGEAKASKNRDFVAIINYDILSDWADRIKKNQPKTVIIDESHYIKNRKAKRTKAVKKVCRMADHVICLTGTPITNRPLEIYEPTQLVAPSLFPRRWDFLQRYCDAKHNGYGWDFSGASNTQELHDKLVGSCMIRRLKADVMKDLPPKVRSVIPLEISNRKEYDSIDADVRVLAEQAMTDPKKKKNALAKIEELKQAAVRGKLKGCFQWIEDFLESGEKLVVFCHHKFVVDELMNNYGIWTRSDESGKRTLKAVKVDGSVSQKDRQAAVDAFQKDDDVRLFIGTMAAKEGLTLTAASNTVHLELWWTPGDHDQAEDRVHRIGQEAESVGAYYLVAKDTVEERIARLIDRKRKVLASVLDGKEVETDDLLTELLREMAG